MVRNSSNCTSVNTDMLVSDVDLVGRIAVGDRSAFAEFYDRYVPQVMGLLRRIIRNQAEAEDVLQEAFLQVWKTSDRYDEERASPKAWLMLIARSRALDFLRRRRLNPVEAPETEPARNADPTLPLIESETAEHVRAALEQLPEVQRTAIRLAFYSGLTYEHVAQQQAIPLGTAKTRIRLGMKQLRILLQDNCKVAGP